MFKIKKHTAKGQVFELLTQSTNTFGTEISFSDVKTREGSSIKSATIRSYLNEFSSFPMFKNWSFSIKKCGNTGAKSVVATVKDVDKLDIYSDKKPSSETVSLISKSGALNIFEKMKTVIDSKSEVFIDNIPDKFGKKMNRATIAATINKYQFTHFNGMKFYTRTIKNKRLVMGIYECKQID